MPHDTKPPAARATRPARAFRAAYQRPASMRRILIPAAIVLVLSPALPATAWWLGVALLSLSAVAVIRTAFERLGWITESDSEGRVAQTFTVAQNSARRVLGLVDCKTLPTAAHLAVYGLAGAVLLTAGAAVRRYQVERERLAVAAVEQEVENRAKVAQANQKVATYCQSARTASVSGEYEWALKLLEIAAGTPDATDFSLIASARAEVNNYQAQHLLNRAEGTLDGGDIDAASRLIREAMNIPQSAETDRAKLLETHIRMTTDPERVKAVLVAVPDDQYDRLNGGGPLPPDLTSDFRVLESRARLLAESCYVAAGQVRQAHRMAERKRLEEERLAQDAEQERRNDAAATREADRKRRDESAKRNATPSEDEPVYPSGSSSVGRGPTHIGPRGGQYHYTPTGKKSYERRRR